MRKSTHNRSGPFNLARPQDQPLRSFAVGLAAERKTLAATATTRASRRGRFAFLPRFDARLRRRLAPLLALAAGVEKRAAAAGDGDAAVPVDALALAADQRAHAVGLGTDGV